MLVRALVDRTADAREWVRAVETGAVAAHVPGHLEAEVAHALLRYVRTGHLGRAEAVESLRVAVALPLNRYRLSELVAGALGVALDLGLTVYDACYWALAEALAAPLVTADRKLAAAYERSVLIP